MLAYTNHGKTTSAKRNSGRKSTSTERDRLTLTKNVPKNHRTVAAQVTAALNIHLKTLFAQKLFYMSFTNPTSTAGLELLNL
jgi:hypothetical protein